MTSANMVLPPPPGYEAFHPPTPGYEATTPPTPNPPAIAAEPLIVPPHANTVLPVDPKTTAMQAIMQSMQLMHENMHQWACCQKEER